MMAKRNGIQISLVFAPIRVGAPDHPSVQPGIRAAESWRGLRFTEFELRRLDAGEKTWTPNARPLLPDQTGHPSLDFPANSRLDLTDSRGVALLQGATGATREISDLAIHLGGAQPLHWLVFITAAGTGRNRPLANPNPAI
jgi:hypothetical protein